jgi:hypothetical protein
MFTTLSTRLGFIPFIREKRRPIIVRVAWRQPARYRNGRLDMSPGAGAPTELLSPSALTTTGRWASCGSSSSVLQRGRAHEIDQETPKQLCPANILGK